MAPAKYRGEISQEGRDREMNSASIGSNRGKLRRAAKYKTSCLLNHPILAQSAAASRPVPTR